MDNKNTKEVERKYILLIDFSMSGFHFSEKFILKKGEYSVNIGCCDLCDIVLNLPDVDNEHAKIIIENEYFFEIIDVSSQNYSILKLNINNGLKLMIKKNVIYDMFDSHFFIGNNTKVSLYQEIDYQHKKEKESEKELLKINNEVSLSIMKHDDKQFILFKTIDNNCSLLEKTNLLTFCKIDSVLIDLTKKLNDEDKFIDLLNDDSTTSIDKVRNNFKILPNISKEIEVIDITSNKRKIPVKKNNLLNKSYLLNQIKDLCPYKIDYPEKLINTRSIRGVGNKLKDVSSSTNNEQTDNLIVNQEVRNSQSNTSDNDDSFFINCENNKSFLERKTKRKLGVFELQDLNNDHHGRIQDIKDKSRKFDAKKHKVLQNIKIYWNEKNVSLEEIQTLIETNGGNLINNHTEKNCIVICDQSNVKFIRSMKKTGIHCYSKGLIIEGIKKHNLDYEKFKL